MHREAVLELLVDLQIHARVRGIRAPALERLSGRFDAGANMQGPTPTLRRGYISIR